MPTQNIQVIVSHGANFKIGMKRHLGALSMAFSLKQNSLCK